MARMPDLSRRAVLRLGVGAAAGAAGAYALGGLVAPRPSSRARRSPWRRRRPTGPARTAGPVPRPQPPDDGHRIVRLRRARRRDAPTGRSPGRRARPRRCGPVIALHGKGSDAATRDGRRRRAGPGRRPSAAGLPPFAVVAVDGGGSYWHKRASGEDSGAMVLDELIPMLGEQGLDTSRVGVPRLVDGRLRRAAARRPARAGPHRGDLARSARRCGCRRVRRRRARSTAPTTSPPTACSGLPALASIPIRIDCGNSDPFYSATQAFIAQLPNPPAGGFSPGGHDGAFWSSQLPGRTDLDGAAAHCLTVQVRSVTHTFSPLARHSYG